MSVGMLSVGVVPIVIASQVVSHLVRVRMVVEAAVVHYRVPQTIRATENIPETRMDKSRAQHVDTSFGGVLRRVCKATQH